MAWYFKHHHGHADDPGLPAMFFDRGKVGPFAITQRAFERGDGRALFKLLVAVAMFQRRQDVQILRILRGMARRDVREVCDAGRLQALVDGARCPLLRTNVDLISRCDLGKDLDTKTGICGHRPRTLCHLKRHTVVLKRYGHFGKVPTSAALMLREEGVRTLGELRARVLKEDPDPFARAMAMEGKLSQIWRVNQKLACMFLSAVCNPDLSSDAPWSSGVDWTHFVVVDSNADLFLASINYRRGASYDERRRFICAVAREIDLSSLDGRLHPYNPRLVQQAMYLFMSAANRRAAPRDCMHHGPAACRRCPSRLADRCPVRAS